MSSSVGRLVVATFLRYLAGRCTHVHAGVHGAGHCIHSSACNSPPCEILSRAPPTQSKLCRYRSGKVTVESAAAYVAYCDALKRLASSTRADASMVDDERADGGAPSNDTRTHDAKGGTISSSTRTRDVSGGTIGSRLHTHDGSGDTADADGSNRCVCASSGTDADGPMDSSASGSDSSPHGGDCWVDTAVIRLKERVGFAHAAYAGLLEVRTECVAVVQHDLAFVRGIDLGALCDALTTHHRVSRAASLLLS